MKALLIGNGRLGAMIFGYPYHEKLQMMRPGGGTYLNLFRRGGIRLF